jgi:hypothetical protein
MAAGSSPCCIEAGDYTLRIEMISGSRTRVDVARFDDGTTPVQTVRWGTLKALYR